MIVRAAARRAGRVRPDRGGGTRFRCAGCTTRSLSPVHRPARWRSALARGSSWKKGLYSFPGLGAFMEQGSACETDLGSFIMYSRGTYAAAAAHAPSPFVHSSLYCLRQAQQTGGIVGPAEYFRRIRKAYLIGEAAKEFAATLEGRVPDEISEALEVAIRTPPVTRGRRRPRAGGAAVAGLRVIRPEPQLRNPRQPFRELVMALPGVKPVV